MNKDFGSARMVLSAPHAAFARRTLVAALLASALVLGGCGVRGNLEAPPEAKATGAATSPDAADPGSNSVVKAKPHKPFVLDGLLR
jgi:predicted small lipoprotein YifL